MNPRATGTLTKGWAALFAGSISTVLVWLVTQYGGVQVPADVVAALTTLLMFAALWITPLFPGEVEFLTEPIQKGNMTDVVDMAQPSRIRQDGFTDQQRREIGRMLADHATGVIPAHLEAATRRVSRSARVEPTAQAAAASHVASTSQEQR